MQDKTSALDKYINSSRFQKDLQPRDYTIKMQPEPLQNLQLTKKRDFSMNDSLRKDKKSFIESANRSFYQEKNDMLSFLQETKIQKSYRPPFQKYQFKN